jgi:uncharacterized SAM-binding protein YcdF (DUF218 family)
MKKIFAIGALVIIGVLAAVVSFRLSTDALSIIVGAILGMIAILPTIMLVGYLLKKNQDAMLANAAQAHQAQPPVVVVSGGVLPSHLVQPQTPAPAAQPMLPPPSQAPPRKFRLMGYEETDQVELSDEEWIMAG